VETGGIRVHTPVSTLLLTLYRRNTCAYSCFHTSDIIQEEYMYMLSMYMYSSCIMSEEEWKQEHVLVPAVPYVSVLFPTLSVHHVQLFPPDIVD
jgi:hypothetical protein